MRKANVFGKSKTIVRESIGPWYENCRHCWKYNFRCGGIIWALHASTVQNKEELDWKKIELEWKETELVWKKSNLAKELNGGASLNLIL